MISGEQSFKPTLPPEVVVDFSIHRGELVRQSLQCIDLSLSSLIPGDFGYSSWKRGGSR
jgi:hypothetical protein